MQNPEHSYSTLDPLTMMQYDTHKNIPWNITEYKPQREYLDPDLEVKKRRWAEQKKGIKDTKYQTKRGFYMDYDLKIAKGIPSTHDHVEPDRWDYSKLKKKGEKNKINSALKKNTYIERIEIEQIKHKVPGVATYSLEKSMKEINANIAKMSHKKYSCGDKRFFYQDTELLSDKVPGVGCYTTRGPVPKLRLNVTDHTFWEQKHKKEQETVLKRQMARPTAGTYNPMNVTISTFDDKFHSPQKDSKVNYFGCDARFEYTRPSKKKTIEVRPDPSTYKTTLEWRGKGTDCEKPLWTEMVWKGNAGESVYH